MEKVTRPTLLHAIYFFNKKYSRIIEPNLVLFDVAPVYEINFLFYYVPCKCESQGIWQLVKYMLWNSYAFIYR